MSNSLQQARDRFWQRHWQGGTAKCFYCDIALQKSFRTVDHMIPKSRGGTDDMQNLVPSCRACNTAKADMTAAEFAEFVSRAGGIREVKRIYGKNPTPRTKDIRRFM